VMVHELLEAGISGFVLKTAGIQELIIGIKKVAEGELYFSETVSKDLLRAIQKNQTQPLLTPREIEILKLIVAEKSNSQIGEALFISERTVESHRKNIYQKTEVQSLVGLVKYAFANKLV
jgi:two-component system, NarL family, nitrate/nitrite response regulator NarL